MQKQTSDPTDMEVSSQTASALPVEQAEQASSSNAPPWLTNASQ
jgi:hypothetical protein